MYLVPPCSLDRRHRRHSSPTHRNAGKRGTSMGPMIYSETMTQDDHECESLEDDVCVPMMAYSVGTLDQRRGEPSHLPKSRTSCEFTWLLSMVLIWYWY